MENQCNIQNACFEIRVLAVRTKNMQQIFCGRKLWIWHVDKQALAIVIMAVCLITIYRKHRE